jgi:hypothetical protein
MIPPAKEGALKVTVAEEIIKPDKSSKLFDLRLGIYLTGR